MIGLETSRFIDDSGRKSKGVATVARFVSFLDIMGFKDMVARCSHSMILEKLYNLSDFVSGEVFEKDNVHFAMFSDSILVYTDSNDYDAFKDIVLISSRIVSHSISIGLPLKGALAMGECTATIGEKQLYFGQPIIDAYMLEENLVLYGIVIHNTAEEMAIRLSDESKELAVYNYKVVLKNSVSEHYVINWYSFDVDSSVRSLVNIRKTVSDSPRRYIDNTLSCIENYKSKVLTCS